MNAQISGYQTQAIAATSAIKWLADLQSKALEVFLNLGFPTRTDPLWKYTSLATFLNESFMVQAPDMDQLQHPMMPLPLDSKEVIVSTGVVLPFQVDLPPGVIIMPVLQAIEDHPDKVRPYLGQLINYDNSILAWNMAMLLHGVFVYVPAGVRIEQPLSIRHTNAVQDQALHMHHLVVLEAGSSLHLVESYQGTAKTKYMMNTVTEIFLAPNSVLTHVKLQQESNLAYHFGHVLVKQAANSIFNGHLVSLGGLLSRNDTTVVLNEEYSECNLRGLYAPGAGQHMDQHTHVTHAVPNGRSDQNYKGVLTGKSRAVFDGLVDVKKDAQHTQANQQNKNILLSELSEVNTHPQLQIDADDVVCTHGATVGQLDPEALFYFAARGVSATQARKHLIQAFIAENISAVPGVEFSAWLSSCLMDHLGGEHAL